MSSVFDVADEIAHRFEFGVPVAKLNRLLFLCQAYSISRLERPMFDEPLEKWRNGPVSRDINDWATAHDVISVREVDRGSKSNLAPEDLAIIDHVVSRYGALSSMQISDIIYVRAAKPPVLSQQDIKDFFLH
ncbi:Panacea domain-containing protein [Actinomyces vulturis]|uniref:Panacea domain-containing protein n=1 Tax=Actinomyces vulturis TaxID=1857645 RepID=UPI00082DD699|nr:Panacea domain-containing protein [Actinomyces vulturis]